MVWLKAKKRPGFGFFDPCFGENQIRQNQIRQKIGGNGGFLADLGVAEKGGCNQKIVLRKSHPDFGGEYPFFAAAAAPRARRARAQRVLLVPAGPGVELFFSILLPVARCAIFPIAG